MRREELPTDHLEAQLASICHSRSILAAAELEILEELDRRQVATRDGSRSLSEWVGVRLDLSVVSAKSLVRTMQRTVERPDLRKVLASGQVSFDRVEALSKISEDVGLLSHLDVGGAYREAARRSRITAESEIKTAESNHLFL